MEEGPVEGDKNKEKNKIGIIISEIREIEKRLPSLESK